MMAIGLYSGPISLFAADMASQGNRKCHIFVRIDTFCVCMTISYFAWYHLLKLLLN